MSIIEINSKLNNSNTKIFLINHFKEYCLNNNLNYKDVFKEYKNKIKNNAYAV
jgi:hypothetical protein